MSRIGKLPIKIPTTVDINVTDNNVVVKGKFGTLERTIPEVIRIEQTDDKLIVGVTNETRANKALHGLYRTLINNMLVGVSEQFLITLANHDLPYEETHMAQLIVWDVTICMHFAQATLPSMACTMSCKLCVVGQAVPCR